MANYYAPSPAGLRSQPPVKPADAAYGGRVYRFRAIINLATINGGSAVTTSDAIQLATVPAGYVLDKVDMISSVSLTTSVQAIGTSSTHASNGQLRAAAAYGTTAEVLSSTSTSAQKAATALTADTPIWMTLATANLPTTGTVVVDIYATKP
jgi:hypothetical protein